MASTLTLITTFTVWAVVIWLPTWFVYLGAARGTRARYSSRTIMRPINFVIPLHFSIRVIEGAIAGSWFWLVLDLFNVCWTAVEIARFNASDEDDWWKKTGKKLRRFVRSYTRSLVLKPISITSR